MKKEGKTERVNPFLEHLVKKIAKKLGLQPTTVRNTALLYGLYIIRIVKKIPKNDEEFLHLMFDLYKIFKEEEENGEIHQEE